MGPSLCTHLHAQKNVVHSNHFWNVKSTRSLDSFFLLCQPFLHHVFGIGCSPRHFVDDRVRVSQRVDPHDLLLSLHYVHWSCGRCIDKNEHRMESGSFYGTFACFQYQRDFAR